MADHSAQRATGFWRRFAAKPEPPPAPSPDGGFETLFGERARASAIAPETTRLPEPSPASAAVQAADRDFTLRAWAARELAHWRLHPADPEDAAKVFQHLNETDPRLFLYRLQGSQVERVEKAPALHEEGALGRADHYLNLFRMAAAALPDDYHATLALELNDKLPFTPIVPVFCFQKRIEQRGILLPDIDFLVFDFYAGEHFRDDVHYEDKMADAIFSGSTTGGEITPAMARECALPRLRAARFFQDHGRVRFRLPNIVQTTEEAARAILAEMPFCQGEPVQWKAQFQRRYLLSMDGNGATCSRVAIALRSQSVLMKYDSPDLLYYFQALQPWRHYIPISADSDVEKLLDIDDWSPGLVQSIAEESTRFAVQYLNREAVLAYTTQLLLLYRECFTNGAAASAPASR